MEHQAHGTSGSGSHHLPHVKETMLHVCGVSYVGI